MVSAPAPPSIALLPLLPVMVLARPLPVPLISPVPVSVRFSTLALRLRDTEDRTVSVPSPASSVTTSKELSTI
jgi:hypothetical protein